MIFIIGCGPESIESPELKELEISESTDISTATKEFIKSPIFLEGWEQYKESQLNKTSENSKNGAYFVQQNMFGFFPLYHDKGVIVIAVFFQPGMIKVMPNGLAELDLSVNNPFVIYIDDEKEIGLSANECLERNSTFSLKYKGDLEISEDFFGNVRYRVIQPLKTAYIAKGTNILVSDADEYDEETDTVTCREDNVTELNFDFTYIFKLNNEADSNEYTLNLRVR